MKSLLTLLLVGLSVGLGNFAASIAIGLGGISKSLRLRIAAVFGLFETGMPIVGLVIGHKIAHLLGGNADLIGGCLLGIMGIYLIFSALKRKDDKEIKEATKSFGKLLLVGFSLGIDNLVVGFGLGANKEPLLTSVLVIGAVSVALALFGLELGSRLSSRVEEYSEILSGAILLLVGVLLGLKLI